MRDWWVYGKRWPAEQRGRQSLRLGLLSIATLLLAILPATLGSVAAQDSAADPTDQGGSVYEVAQSETTAADPLPVLPAVEQDETTIADNQFADVVLPGGMGETDIQAYVKETGHSIRGTMLDYWRANGASAVYGNPISEPFAAVNGLYSQAFERAIFQYHPEFQWTEEPDVRLMPIGGDVLRDRLGGLRTDGRRGGGGGDRRGSAWRPLDPAGKTVARAVNNGDTFAEATGHTIAGAFRQWYDSHEGFFYLGNPLSQPVTERGVTVQYFDGAVLLRSQEDEIRLAPIAAELAPRLGIQTKRIARNDLPLVSESLFETASNPDPEGDTEAEGRKRIEVSISEQKLWAYQGGSVVLTTLVSTGIEPNHTEQGLFHVRYKLPSETMKGFTDGTGEVVGLGDGSGTQKGVPYEVKDVPNVMYFNSDAEALHGAYWHNNFGNRMSHGCVNLPLDVAAFLFGWAPIGTEVWVHE